MIDYISIITPVYNGGKLLKRLYDSLELQDNKHFTWIIIDDGSTDNTQEIINSIEQSASFEVKSERVKNGGKQRAINAAFSLYPNYPFYLIIDCDEVLPRNSIHDVIEKVKMYEMRADIGAIYGWRKIKNDQKNLKKVENRPRTDKIMNIYERIEFGNEYGDGIIGYYNRLIKSCQFVVYPGEKYVGEITLLQKAAIENIAPKIVYIDDIISEGEYTDGGLTSQGRKLRIRNPLGMIYYSYLMQSEMNKSNALRVKHAIGAQAYASIHNIGKEKLREVGIPETALKWWAKIPGILLGLYWTKKCDIVTKKRRTGAN